MSVRISRQRFCFLQEQQCADRQRQLPRFPRGERVVELRRDAVGRALNLVRGRVQMTVRVSSDEARAAGDAGPRVEIAPRITANPGSGPKTGTQYLQERKALGEPRLEPQVVAAIDAAVRALIAAARVDKGNGRTLATVYHLIDRGADRAYRQVMAETEGHMRRYLLTVSGPWAAFAFAPELWT